MEQKILGIRLGCHFLFIIKIHTCMWGGIMSKITLNIFEFTPIK